MALVKCNCIFIIVPAKTAKDLRKEKLALYVSSGNYLGRNRADIFLYDANALLLEFFEEIEWSKERTGNVSPKDALSSIAYSPTVFGKGTVSAREKTSCSGMEVVAAGAQHRYGPFLYNVLSTVFGTWIMSDRSSITTKARKVWKYMYDHPDLYHMEPISNKSQCQPSERGEYLKYKYRPKSTNRARTKALKNNHDKVVKKLIERGASAQTIDRFFRDCGELFFNSMMDA